MSDTKTCLMCFGTGRVKAYRGPSKDLACIHCDGTGAAPRPEAEPSIEMQAEAYRMSHEDAVALGYPSITEALEHLADLKAEPSAGDVERGLVDQLTGALRFIMAFYEPGQRYLDTEAWKVAEAGGRAALARGEAALAATPSIEDVSGLREALEAARQFIRNGVEMGYIRMPDPETPDPAHDTLPMIEAALASLHQEGRGHE